MTDTDTEFTEDLTPDVEHDDLLGIIDKRMKEEYARASDAGESAADTREFLDETGLNSQAFSWLKSIVKKIPKKDGTNKAMDIIRSLKLCLPMVENHVLGQSTAEMDLTPPEDTSEGDVEAPEADTDVELEGDATEFEDAAAQLEDTDTVVPLAEKRSNG